MADITSSRAPNLLPSLGKRWAWLLFILMLSGISTIYAFQQEPNEDAAANSYWSDFSQPIERNAHLKHMQIAEDLPVLAQLKDDSLMMLGSQGTVFSSKDEGKTWQVVEQTAEKVTGWKAGIAQLPDGRLAAIDEAGRVLMADAHGSNWQAIQVDEPEKSVAPDAKPDTAKAVPAAPAKNDKVPPKTTKSTPPPNRLMLSERPQHQRLAQSPLLPSLLRRQRQMRRQAASNKKFQANLEFLSGKPMRPILNKKTSLKLSKRSLNKKMPLRK